MPTTTYEDENLRKNAVLRAELQEVFASDLSYAEDLDPSDRGNSRAIVIGWTYTGRILEIGIEYFESEGREHIFHAMDAGKSYKKRLPREDETMKVGEKKLLAQERLNKLRTQAKKEISVAGTVQFRMDEKTMLLLMKAADKKKVPLGTLVRMWTVERLAAEGYSK